eukprot:EG_transcript_13427
MKRRPEYAADRPPPSKAPRREPYPRQPSAPATAYELAQQFDREGLLDVRALDDRILADLDRLGTAGARQALEQFCAADPATIRNPCGYLKGIIQKIQTPFPRPGPPPRATSSDSYWHLLRQYHDEGVLDMHQLDAGIMLDLAALPPELAVQAVETYAAADQRTVRNPCGFMKGILNSVAYSGADITAPLPPLVQLHLDKAIHKGVIEPHQVDAALYALMAGMDPTAAIRALSEFAMLDPDTIQNKPGMLSSILKRHQAEDRATSAQRPHSDRPPAVDRPSSVLELVQRYHEDRRLRMTDFDGAILRELEALPLDQAQKALDTFVATDQRQIRNASGFLKGIIRSVRDGAHGQSSDGGPLDPVVQAQLDAAIREGFISKEQCDAALLAALSAFSVDSALHVLSEFMEADPATVQNKAGFLCGIMRRVRLA